MQPLVLPDHLKEAFRQFPTVLALRGASEVSRQGGVPDRLVLLTPDHLVLASPKGGVHRSLRISDVERVAVQDSEHTLVVCVKVLPHVQEPSLVVALPSDDPYLKVVPQPPFVRSLNAARKKWVRDDLPVTSIPRGESVFSYEELGPFDGLSLHQGGLQLDNAFPVKSVVVVHSVPNLAGTRGVVVKHAPPDGVVVQLPDSKCALRTFTVHQLRAVHPNESTHRLVAKSDETFGISFNETEDNRLYVYDVIPGSPADRAGVHPGCYITACNHVPVFSNDTLLPVVRQAVSQGDSVLLTVVPSEPSPESDRRDVVSMSDTTRASQAVDSVEEQLAQTRLALKVVHDRWKATQEERDQAVREAQLNAELLETQRTRRHHRQRTDPLEKAVGQLVLQHLTAEKGSRNRRKSRPRQSRDHPTSSSSRDTPRGSNRGLGLTWLTEDTLGHTSHGDPLDISTLLSPSRSHGSQHSKHSREMAALL